MPLRWLQLFRPRRRWFQYRLRTLFVLMTLVCVWLSYNAWRYQREQEIVAGILAKDPQAVIVWAGPSWLDWLDKDSVPMIFRRVEEVTIKAQIDIPADVLTLQLQKCSALKWLKLDYIYDWDVVEQIHKTRVLKDLLPEVAVSYSTTLDCAPQLIADYLKNPTDAAAARVRVAIALAWQYAVPPSITPANEIAEFMRSGYYGGMMPAARDECIGGLLACRHNDLRIKAGRHLWARHSFRYARKVIAFTAKLAADSNTARELKLRVEGDLAPKRILAELQRPDGDDTRWWVWLAAIRPHPSLVPSLIQLAQGKDPLPEVIYALGQSKDPRSLSPLLKVLTECQDGTTRCIAADAIGEIGDSTVEPQLIKLLRCADLPIQPWIDPPIQVALCHALAKIGTARSLPELRKLAVETSYPATVDIARAARKAIKAIERRSRVKETP
jgi:hypothetical protein